VIPLLLSLALWAPPPLSCPPGSLVRGARPPLGEEEWCEAPDLDSPADAGRREGPALRYYEDGQVWIESSYARGRLSGHFLELFRGGGKAREGFYEEGKRVGRWAFYAEDGTLLETSSFKEDLLDGPFVQYWPSGRVKNEGRHCLGIQCGRWRSFDESGRQISSVEFAVPRDEP